mmetsp:Transcript_11513/g.18957  ORF Transcript_11513/g.18957 Transcript_11513/m.18957 type:complete len:544 (+) Transcript_11513:94-1725(+)
MGIPLCYHKTQSCMLVASRLPWVFLLLLTTSGRGSYAVQPSEPPPWADPTSCRGGESNAFEGRGENFAELIQLGERNVTRNEEDGYEENVSNSRNRTMWLFCDPFKMTLRWEAEELNRQLLLILRRPVEGCDGDGFRISILIGDRSREKRRRRRRTRTAPFSVSRYHQMSSSYRRRKKKERVNRNGCDDDDDDGDNEDNDGENSIHEDATDVFFFPHHNRTLELPRRSSSSRSNEQELSYSSILRSKRSKTILYPSILPYGARLYAQSLFKEWYNGGEDENDGGGGSTKCPRGVIVLSTQSRHLGWHFLNTEGLTFNFDVKASYCFHRAKSSRTTLLAQFHSFSYKLLSNFLRCLVRFIDEEEFLPLDGDDDDGHGGYYMIDDTQHYHQPSLTVKDNRTSAVTTSVDDDDDQDYDDNGSNDAADKLPLLDFDDNDDEEEFEKNYKRSEEAFLGDDGYDKESRDHDVGENAAGGEEEGTQRFVLSNGFNQAAAASADDDDNDDDTDGPWFELGEEEEGGDVAVLAAVSPRRNHLPTAAAAAAAA